MGFFKNLATLTRQGYEMQQRMDVGASMAQASAAMTQAGAMIAAMTPAPTTAAQEQGRMRTTAAVTGARQQPMTIGMDAVVEVDLLVALPGGAPLPVQHLARIAPLHLARVVPGAALPISMVPGRADTVRIEWSN